MDLFLKTMSPLISSSYLGGWLYCQHILLSSLTKVIMPHEKLITSITVSIDIFFNGWDKVNLNINMFGHALDCGSLWKDSYWKYDWYFQYCRSLHFIIIELNLEYNWKQMFCLQASDELIAYIRGRFSQTRSNSSVLLSGKKLCWIY